MILKVPNGENPYTVIGQYIRDHITAIEDIIATIEIDGIRSNELFMVNMEEDGYFVWKSDWWEGEKNIALIDFFPVSDAIADRENDPYAKSEENKRGTGITIKEAIKELKYAKCACNFDSITSNLAYDNDEDKRRSEAFGIAIMILEDLINSETHICTGLHTVVLDKIIINGKVYLAADKVSEIIDKEFGTTQPYCDAYGFIDFALKIKKIQAAISELKEGE